MRNGIEEILLQFSSQSPSKERAVQAFTALSDYLHGKKNEGEISGYSLGMHKDKYKRYEKILVRVISNDGQPYVYHITINETQISLHEEEET